jgi:hypothetical protein
MEKIKMVFFVFMPSWLQRITRRQGGGSAGVYDDTLRKPTTMPTKLAEEGDLVWKYRKNAFHCQFNNKGTISLFFFYNLLN